MSQDASEHLQHLGATSSLNVNWLAEIKRSNSRVLNYAINLSDFSSALKVYNLWNLLGKWQEKRACEKRVRGWRGTHSSVGQRGGCNLEQSTQETRQVLVLRNVWEWAAQWGWRVSPEHGQKVHGLWSGSLELLGSRRMGNAGPARKWVC